MAVGRGWFVAIDKKASYSVPNFDTASVHCPDSVLEFRLMLANYRIKSVLDLQLVHFSAFEYLLALTHQLDFMQPPSPFVR